MIQPITLLPPIIGTQGEYKQTTVQFTSDTLLTGKLLRFTPALWINQNDADPTNTAYQILYPASNGEVEVPLVASPIYKNYKATLDVLDGFNFKIKFEYIFGEDLNGWVGATSPNNQTFFSGSGQVYNGQRSLGMFVDVGGDTARIDVPTTATTFCDSATLNFTYFNEDDEQVTGFTPSEDLTVSIDTSLINVGNNYFAGFFADSNISNATDFVTDLGFNYAQVGNGINTVSDLPDSCFSGGNGFVTGLSSSAELTLSGSCLNLNNSYRLYIVYQLGGVWQSCISNPIVQLVDTGDVITGSFSCEITDNFGNVHSDCCLTGLSSCQELDICVSMSRSDYQIELDNSEYSGVLEDFYKGVTVYGMNTEPTSPESVSGKTIQATGGINASGITNCVTWKEQEGYTGFRYLVFCHEFEYSATHRDKVYFTVPLGYAANNTVITPVVSDGQGNVFTDIICAEGGGVYTQSTQDTIGQIVCITENSNASTLALQIFSPNYNFTPPGPGYVLKAAVAYREFHCVNTVEPFSGSWIWCREEINAANQPGPEWIDDGGVWVREPQVVSTNIDQYQNCIPDPNPPVPGEVVDCPIDIPEFCQVNVLNVLSDEVTIIPGDQSTTDNAIVIDFQGGTGCQTLISKDGSNYSDSSSAIVSSSDGQIVLDASEVVIGSEYCFKAICQGSGTSEPLCDDCDIADVTINTSLTNEDFSLDLITSGLDTPYDINGYIKVIDSFDNSTVVNLPLSGQYSGSTIGPITESGVVVTGDASVELFIDILTLSGCGYQLNYMDSLGQGNVSLIPTICPEPEPEFNCSNVANIDYSCDSDTQTITVSTTQSFTGTVASDEFICSTDGINFAPCSGSYNSSQVTARRNVTFDNCDPISIEQTITCEQSQECINNSSVDVDLTDNVLTLTNNDTFNSSVLSDVTNISIDGGVTFGPYMMQINLVGGESIIWNRTVVFDDGCPDLTYSGSLVNDLTGNCTYGDYDVECNYNENNEMFSATFTGDDSLLDSSVKEYSLDGGSTWLPYVNAVSGTHFLVRWVLSYENCDSYQIFKGCAKPCTFPTTDDGCLPIKLCEPIIIEEIRGNVDVTITDIQTCIDLCPPDCGDEFDAGSSSNNFGC